ncbi:MAG: histidine phosphatase family protein [Alphaproteobacteria bacterium]|nr:histidine phosphatase family protein [Alphaproteobacteria bacterium]
MTQFAVIRHGPTAWNEANLNQGRTDVPLSPAGRADVARWRVPSEWSGLPVVASPLRRTHETALLLFGRARIEPRLIEMAWGEWEGRSLAELRAELGPEMAANEGRGLDFRPPGGESPRDVGQRLDSWLASVAAAGERVVAVAHRGVLRVLMAKAFAWNMLGKPPVKLAAAALHVFDVAADGRLDRVAMNVSLLP